MAVGLGAGGLTLGSGVDGAPEAGALADAASDPGDTVGTLEDGVAAPQPARTKTTTKADRRDRISFPTVPRARPVDHRSSALEPTPAARADNEDVGPRPGRDAPAIRAHGAAD